MSRVHRYIPNSEEMIESELLASLGLKSVEELFKSIPPSVRLKRRLNIRNFPSEFELRSHIEAILAKNVTTKEVPTFLGAGVWPSYSPSVVFEVMNRTEFSTSYTPYQPEISQGILQALFEYQSLICRLTGMDYANSSMYDWSSSVGEAARMAMRFTGRERILVPHFMNPEMKLVMETFVEPAGGKVDGVEQSRETGQMVLEDLRAKTDERTACIYIENPSYLGFIEEGVDDIADTAHKKGALLVVGCDTVSLGVLREPGDYGADIVVGEGQALGMPMNYGGPLLGILACRGEKLLREMPGRIVGMTTTLDGKERAFCNALQAREQHIRREKASSNICTNEALMAVGAACYLDLLGPQGLRELCRTIMTKANFAMRLLSEVKEVKVPVFSAFHFREFTVGYPAKDGMAAKVHEALLSMNIHGGKILTDEFPELGESALYCVSEVHTKDEIKLFAESLRKVFFSS